MSHHAVLPGQQHAYALPRCRVLAFVLLFVLVRDAAAAYPRILNVAADQDNPTFRSSLEEITGGETDDYFVRFNPPQYPTLEEMSQYDCVIVQDLTVTVPPEIAPAFGDMLADYVDTGGIVVISEGTDDPQAEKGRILADGYMPVVRGTEKGPLGVDATQAYTGDGKSLLFENISSNAYKSNSFVNDKASVQGNGIVDGTYTNGSIASAYRPDYQVVFLNSYCSGNPYPNVRHCPANTTQLWANACTAAKKMNPDLPDRTSLPTSQPTAIPTLAPTTKSPTPLPTGSPHTPLPTTGEPTTGGPTKSPTKSPSDMPTPLAPSASSAHNLHVMIGLISMLFGLIGVLL
mmetsp:Transcript_14221/g.40812  ORF Transcript_14221/g.40812 Transcript_14221/m.40812 type:complete len:346 (+) Transcript_14221:249-1286(+)